MAIMRSTVLIPASSFELGIVSEPKGCLKAMISRSKTSHNPDAKSHRL